MRKYINWGLIMAMAVVVIGVASCNDDDVKYDGPIDLNQIHLTQAFELWQKSECVVTNSVAQEEATPDYTYKFNLSMYQRRVPSTTVTVDLVVDVDSLNKAKALSDTDAKYARYANAVLMPSQFYRLSSTMLTLHSGEKDSSDEEVTVFCKQLADYVQNELSAATTFVLPISISNPSTYRLNPNTKTIMFFFNVSYTKPAEPLNPDFFPDTEGVEDNHEFEGMRLLWHDEFNGVGAPNPDMWNFEHGFVRNEEDQWYQSDNAAMKDGELVITGRREQVQNTNYQSGSGDWKRNREYAEYTASSIVVKDPYVFKYGTMIVRAKIPVAQGAWPAIWSTGNWWEWPLGGEIDMLEFYKEKIHANVCWGGEWRWTGTWNSANKPITHFTDRDADWADKYHIWRMDWDASYIRIYLDGELMNETDLSKTMNQGDNGAGQGGWQNPYSNDYQGFGQRMMLNLAIGGINGRPIDTDAFPMEYKVDYIRIYQ